MNIRWNIILGVIALGLLAWFYSLNQDEPQLSELIKTPESPDYVGQKMETTIFSPTGQKQYIANAEQVTHYNTDGHTDFQQPVLYLLDVESGNNDIKEKQSWKLRADNATLTKDNQLILKGNVIAQSLLAESRLQRIETERATVNLTTQDIHSDTMVKLNGQNFTSSGLKMTGNLKQQIATLQEQVKTYYEISNK